tara:strand:- start:135 stop:311 length:177 start_codon:yes stop_codon:yes gene_type:complete
MNRKQITTKRVQSIYNFCEELHDNIDELYELMVDGTDAAEKKHVEMMQKKLSELNIDK